MLVNKEVISPGTYYYNDEKTGDPRKLVVTPELTKYWHEQGKAMLDAGLTIPVPYEHDFSAHPMTPKDKLLNNAGWVSDYKLVDNKLFAVADIQDESVAKKLPNTIRWTSPWINSFTDGNGKKWNNVISHLALTLRPRITKQQPFKQPFESIAAALSLATEITQTNESLPQEGYCLSRAGRVVERVSDKRLFPMYPMAFSLFSGVALAEGDMPPTKGKKPPKSKAPESQGGKPDSNPTPGEGEPSVGSGESGDEFQEPGSKGDESGKIDLPPLGDKAGDVSMEEVLCDLLRALGVDCEHSGDEAQFKRNLYTAAMQKVHELTNKGMSKEDEVKPGAVNKGNPPGSPGSNPLIQQEQQPMYMALSLEDINKINDPTMKSIALSMHNETTRANAKTAELEKTLNSLRDAKLKEANDKRVQRVGLIGKVLPKVKPDLDVMLASPAMALSMGEGGIVIDPMEQTLAITEKSISSLPALFTTPSVALSEQPQPSDSDALSQAEEDKLVDDMSRRMGGAVEQKKAS